MCGWLFADTRVVLQTVQERINMLVQSRYMQHSDAVMKNPILFGDYRSAKQVSFLLIAAGVLDELQQLASAESIGQYSAYSCAVAVSHGLWLLLITYVQHTLMPHSRPFGPTSPKPVCSWLQQSNLICREKKVVHMKI